MKKKSSMTLIEWFFFKTSNTLREHGTFTLEDLNFSLRKAGLPESYLDLASNLPDTSFPLKLSIDGYIPDLESQERSKKRKLGLYYTPAVLAENLLKLVEFSADTKVLDPACGDGVFLLEAAKRLVPYSDKPLDNLIGFDVDPAALFVSMTRLLSAFPSQGFPRLYNKNFLKSDIEEKYELVVGNPPYKVNLEEDEKLFLLENFETVEGEKDLYMFFLEKSAKLLKSNGLMMLITPDTWLVNHQTGKLRNYVFENYIVEKLILLEKGFFKKAPALLPAVAVIRNRKSSPDFKTELLVGCDETLNASIKTEALQRHFREETGLKNSLRPPEVRKLLESMESYSLKLSDVAKLGVGIQESVRRKGSVSKFVHGAKKADNFKPVLRGREISPFSINWEGKYIDYGEHLVYRGKPEMFEDEKILYQNIRNQSLKTRIVAALDRNGFYYKNSLSYIQSFNSDYSNLFLTGLLNSLLVNVWYASSFHSFHITVTRMGQIPLPPYNKTLFTKIESCAERLLTGFDDKIMNDLNKLVWQAYFPDLLADLPLLERFLTISAELF